MGILDNLADISSETDEPKPTPQASASDAFQTGTSSGQSQMITDKSDFVKFLYRLQTDLPDGFEALKIDPDENELLIGDEHNKWYDLRYDDYNKWHIMSLYLAGIKADKIGDAMVRCNSLNMIHNGEFTSYYDFKLGAIVLKSSGFCSGHDYTNLTIDIATVLIGMRSAQTYQFNE